MKKNAFIIIIAIVMIALVGFGIYYFVASKNKLNQEGASIKTETEKAVEVQNQANETIKNATTNPADKIPNVNPYQNTTNPYKNVNPFE